MVGQRPLTPSIVVRVHVPEHYNGGPVHRYAVSDDPHTPRSRGRHSRLGALINLRRCHDGDKFWDEVVLRER